MFWEINEIKPKEVVKTTNIDLLKKINKRPDILEFLPRRDINHIFKIEVSPSTKEWQEFIKKDIKPFYKKLVKLNDFFYLTNNYTEPTGIIFDYVKNNNIISYVLLNDLRMIKIINGSIFKPSKLERIGNYLNTVKGIKNYKSKIIAKILNTKPLVNVPETLGKVHYGNLYLNNVEINIFPLKEIEGELVLNNSIIHDFKCKVKRIKYLKDSKILSK
jgi:hypothetical protein